jgi:hypothetical protein
MFEALVELLSRIEVDEQGDNRRELRSGAMFD